MNITISGGTGFIGQHVCKALNGKHSLVILTRKPPKDTFENIEYVNLSLSDKIIKEKIKRTELFIHLAAKRPEKKASDQSFNTYLEFLTFTNRILQLLQGSACKQIINISTKGVYGNKNIAPFTEDQIPHPTSIYGLSKVMTEQLFDQYGTSNNIKIIHLRLEQVIGWGEKQKNIVSVFLENALKKQTQTIWGKGIGARTYVYVKDVVHAIETAIYSKKEGSFNIGWPKGISHAQMAESINNVFENTKIEYLTDKPEDTSIEEIETLLAKNVLHWTPRYPTLESALRDMKKDYEEEAN